MPDKTIYVDAHGYWFEWDRVLERSEIEALRKGEFPLKPWVPPARPAAEAEA